MRISNLLRLAGGLSVAAYSVACADDESADILGPDFALTAVVADAGGAYCTDLLAGQTIEAGSVCVSVSGSTLDVTYTTSNTWELSEAHLFIGSTQADMPQSRNGNPKIGNFPYNSGNITGMTSHTFRVDLTPWLEKWSVDPSMTVCNVNNLFVAAHAALRRDNGNGTFQTETGWGNGDPLVDRGSWATGFQIEIGCTGDDPEPETKSETAFAFGGDLGTCFIGFDFDHDGSDDGFNRWGWSNGPLKDGDNKSFPIYAAAGQCDLTKGTHVGTLSVSYSSGTATVTFTMTEASFLGYTYEMLQTHLYVGNEPLPRDKRGEYTVAPGQYPSVVEFDAPQTVATYTVHNLSGEIYVVAHSVVGPFPSTN